MIYVPTYLRIWNATNADRKTLKRDHIRMLLVIVLALSMGGVLIDGGFLR